MRRAARITAWTIGSLLVALVLLVTAVLIAGNTAGGRGLIEREVARFSGGRVRLAGLSGAFPQALRLEQLELSDAGGVWLTAQHLSLRWSPLALLMWHVKIQALQLARLDIERRPVTQPSEGGSTNPPHVDLQQLSIDRLELGPELAGARVSLSVRGTLHLESLTNATAQVTARRSDGRGDYELTARLDPLRMDASLTLEEPASGPLENLLGYPGLGALSVQATLGGPRNAEQLELNAHAGGLRAAVRGTLDLSRRSADLDYDLDAPAMTPRPGLSWQRISLHGRWHGPVSSARANARLELAALEAPGGAGAHAVEATLTADRGALTLHAEADGLTLPGPEPQLLAKSPLRLEAAMKLGDAQRPLELEVDHRLFTLQAHAVTAGAPSGTFDLRLPDLAPLAATAGQKIAGRSEVRGSLRQDATTTHLELEVNSELARGTTAVAELLAGASRLQLAATLTRRSLAVERLALSAQKLSLSASATAARGSAPTAATIQSVHAHYTANVADVSALASAVAGTVSANGTLDGPLKSLAANLRLTSSLSLRGAPREPLEATIAARGLPAHASAQIQAAGRFAGAPLELDASLERAGEALHLSVQRAEWKSARVDGDLTTGANLKPGHGTIRLRIERLADLQPLVGASLGGALDGNLELRPGSGRTYIRARLDAKNLVAANLPADVHLTADGPTDALGLQLSMRSPNLRGEPASLESASRLDLGARELAFERLEMHYRGQTLHLLAPARVSFAQGLAISKLQLGMQRAVMTLDGRFSPALDVRASVHHVDPALINAFMPGTLAQGTLDADMRLEGQASAPSGRVSVTAAGLRFASAGARDLHPLDVHASARLADGSAQLDAHLNAGDSSQLALTGAAPLRGSGSSLDLKLTGKLDAALANPLLEARGQRATGTLAVNATVSGTASSPEVSGTVDLTHGELRDYVRGVHLSDMTAHLVGERGTLRIDRFTARAPPGELSMTGTIGVLQPKLPVELELRARNAQPVTSNIVTSSLNADIKLTGTLRERLQVSGSIDLDRTVINIPNTLPPDVAVLDVRRPGQAPPPPPEHKLVIGLDIRMNAPRQILVQGRGLNAELGGDLHLSGTSDAPRVNGGFELIRGTFALAGSTLTFTKGEVTFSGTGLKGGIDPTLDFTAQSTAADATVTLHVTGFADAPKFELSSSPALPQDEILARLLFGESAAQLTTLQVAEIGAALATLGGIGGGGPSPLVKVQKALGLDRLSVGSSGPTTGTQNSGTTVEAGRYVSSRVYVGARQSTTGFSQAEVDVDLSKHLKLQTRLGNGTATTQGTTPENDPGSSIGLTYQFEY